LSDETTDIALVIQLSFCVRFIENIKVYEEFIKFEPVTDCTGKRLTTVICKIIEDFNLNGMKVAGQDYPYDGAGAMSGWMNGAQAIIQEKYTKAIYVQCALNKVNNVSD